MRPLHGTFFSLRIAIAHGLTGTIVPLPSLETLSDPLSFVSNGFVRAKMKGVEILRSVPASLCMYLV